MEEIIINYPFYKLSDYYKECFGKKIIKISLDAGFTCPNRDGTLSYSGCIFCSPKGSGDFAGNKEEAIKDQFKIIKAKLHKKWPKGYYIAYFQAFTNTYAPIHILREKYNQALDEENVVGISIATRPDCISEEILSLLKELNKKTVVFVELGLQTSNEKTACLINRQYKNDIFETAVKELKNIGINVVVHTIFGLPNETKEDMLNTVKYVCEHKVDGIKLQLLHVLKETKLFELYDAKLFNTLEFDEYIDIVVSALEIIPNHIVIHRLTGDGGRDNLVAPLYSIKKFHILNAIDETLKKRNTWQGKKVTDESNL